MVCNNALVDYFSCLFTGDIQEETITLGSTCIQPTIEKMSLLKNGMSQIRMHYTI